MLRIGSESELGRHHGSNDKITSSPTDMKINKKLMAFLFQITNYWTEAVGYPQKMVITN